jgi:hypothetical protein
VSARQVRTALTLTALVGLLVLGVVLGWRALSSPVEEAGPAAKASASACVKGVDKGDRVKSRQVTVSVYNAGSRTGLAAETLDRLVARGFIGGDVGNAPARLSEVRFVRVLAPTGRDPAARLVALQFGPRTYVEPTRTDLGPGVDVIVGDDFHGVVTAPRSLVARAEGSGC